MAINPNNIEDWYLEEYEVAKVSPISCASNGGSLQLYIPKLMPLISFGIPKASPETLSKSIFINDDTCKPNVSSTIMSQNYKTVTRPTNRKFYKDTLKSGMQVQVEVKHNNPQEIYVSTKIDPSVGATVREGYFYEKFEGEGEIELNCSGTVGPNGFSVTGKFVNSNAKGRYIEWHDQETGGK